MLVSVKHPDNMSRKEKMAMISYLYRELGMSEAQKFWLTHCPRISKKSFQEKLIKDCHTIGGA